MKRYLHFINRSGAARIQGDGYFKKLTLKQAEKMRQAGFEVERFEF